MAGAVLAAGAADVVADVSVVPVAVVPGVPLVATVVLLDVAGWEPEGEQAARARARTAETMVFKPFLLRAI